MRSDGTLRRSCKRHDAWLACRLLALLWVAALLPGQAMAQSDTFMDAYTEYTTLLDFGRFEEAVPLAQELVELSEAEFGPEHENAAILLYQLALLYLDLDRTKDAEPPLARALAIYETNDGADSPAVALVLADLAGLYRTQARFAEAEASYKRILGIREMNLGSNHPDVSATLNDLAEIYRDQGRYAAAEGLYRRSLDIDENSFGLDHPELATTLNNLAQLYEVQGRYGEAEPLHKRALVIKEAALGPDDPGVAGSLISLAALYRRQGRYEEAERLLMRALAIMEESAGPGDLKTAAALSSLAVLFEHQDRENESIQYYERALAIFEGVLGSEHPNVAASLTNLAGLCADPACRPRALSQIRRATAISRERAARGHLQRSGGAVSEQNMARPGLLLHLGIVEAMAGSDPPARASFLAESFEVAQLTRTNAAARAVAGMATRFAAGGDSLARLVRERQDALALWQTLDEKIIAAASRPPEARDGEVDARLRAEQKRLDGLLAALDQRLLRDFPNYAEIANPRPLSLGEARGLLGADEAILSYTVAERSTYVHLVRADDAAMFKADIGAEALRDAVARLRGTLTPEGLFGLKDLLDRGYAADEAYRLYRILFAPLEARLAGVSHLFVVPDEALQSLPLGVLLTAEPADELERFADYRQAPWLARRYAMTTLPSVSSLRALRRFARAAKARKPFIGFGDPLLEGGSGGQRGADAGTLFRGAGGIDMEPLFRGELADVRAVRRLARLPDTADELRAIARTLEAGEDALLLGSEMTESAVKRSDLASSRVIAFATHGLVAGDMAGTAEPALVFTPPPEPTYQDDGLLTASEIARDLKLDADLIILSACNTAAADGTPGAEALSGLAKAFFYAGSRALLVSHWPVASQAAVLLTTRMFEAAAADPAAGRAESLRRSMLAMIDDPERPYLAHPLFWAPFVVVGEGGAGRIPAYQ